MQNTSLITIKDNQTAFIPYLVAGHTSNEVFSSALRLLNDVGADLIEIGIPFTDPIAEGKIIESAHHHALKHNFVLDDICRIVKEFKTYSDTPVIAMGYTNSFINPSSEHIASKLSECGFNGVLIVDLPASEKSIINSFKDKTTFYYIVINFFYKFSRLNFTRINFQLRVYWVFIRVRNTSKLF